MAKYYAIKVGKQTGIFTSWDQCKALVSGYPNAKYKSFKTMEEAEEYMSGATFCEEKKDMELPTNYAFVDGSFNSATGTYGYGGFVVVDGVKHVIQGSGTDPEMAAMRNVAGEISGAMASIDKARELEVTEMTIYYDYEGINAWVSGDWKAKNACTQRYASYMNEARLTGMQLTFVHVKGHTGIDGNEEADRLAKEACGI